MQTPDRTQGTKNKHSTDYGEKTANTAVPGKHIFPFPSESVGTVNSWFENARVRCIRLSIFLIGLTK